VNGEPPVNVMSKGPVAAGRVVIELCTRVIALIAVDQVVLLLFVVSDVFSM